MYDGGQVVDLIQDIHIALLYLFIDEYEKNSKFELPRDTGKVFYLLRNCKGEFFEAHFRAFWPELMLGLSTMPEFDHIVSTHTHKQKFLINTVD